MYFDEAMDGLSITVPAGNFCCSQSDHMKSIFLNIANHSAIYQTTKIIERLNLILDR
jgi:hypothetical protein